MLVIITFLAQIEPVRIIPFHIPSHEITSYCSLEIYEKSLPVSRICYQIVTSYGFSPLLTIAAGKPKILRRTLTRAVVVDHIQIVIVSAINMFSVSIITLNRQFRHFRNDKLVSSLSLVFIPLLHFLGTICAPGSRDAILRADSTVTDDSHSRGRIIGL